MSLDLNAAMDAIGDRLETILGLRVYDYPADSIAVPAAVVGFPDGGEYDETYGRGVDSTVIPVHVVVGRMSERTARREVGTYIGGSGDRSVKAVLEADPTLGGAIQSVRVARWAIRPVAVGAIDYLSAAFECEVFA